MAIVGEELAKHFDSIGITQVDIANQLGVSKAYVNSLFSGRSRFGKKQAEKWSNQFGISKSWLLTGEGAMFADNLDDNVVSADAAMAIKVPLYSLEAVAGFHNTGEQQEYIEGEIIWYDAHRGDFAVSITGDSMAPVIPNGSLVLLRPYPVCAIEDLDFGKPHVVVLDDNRAMLKVIKYDRDNPGNIILESYNRDYPPRSIHASQIRHFYLAVGYQVKL